MFRNGPSNARQNFADSSFKLIVKNTNRPRILYRQKYLQTMFPSSPKILTEDVSFIAKHTHRVVSFFREDPSNSKQSFSKICDGET